MRRPTFVYVMRGLASGLFKIGHSWNPRARLRSVATTIEPVELVAAFPGGRAVELAMHRRFAEHLAPDRALEWFRPEGVAAWAAALPPEYRASGVYEVRRIKPHFMPEQAEAMRRHRRAPQTRAEKEAAAAFERLHGHFFAPVSYLDGCGACQGLAEHGFAAPVTATEALRLDRILTDAETTLTAEAA